MRKINLILLLSFSLHISFLQGQISLSDTSDVNTPGILMKKEHSAALMVHTSGFGAGFRTGKHATGYKKRMFEAEITGMKNPKEVRRINPYVENAKSYIYGKENAFLLIRCGMGKQKIINSKPYWGGVELRYFYYGGFSIGLLKPYYLYILNSVDNSNEYILTAEKYDPLKHTPDDIFGKAPYFYNFRKTKPVPGIYLKTGLNFEYGAYTESLKAIEAGIAADFYLREVPVMAFDKNRSYFVSLYFSIHFGKRYN